MNPPRRSPLQRLLSLACEIEPREVSATLTSFLLVLILMGAYYLLRPVRDAMASDWSDAEVSWLWTFTFFFSAAAVSLYGAAVTRIRFHYLVPGVYGFFALTFVLFFFADSGGMPVIDKAFYVWVSVFSLFHISVFWSFMADTFSKPQSKRLFGFIGAGASVGAIGGPAFVTLFAGNTGTGPLLLAAAVMLVLTVPVILMLQRLKENSLHNEAVHAGTKDLGYIGGNPLAGFTVFFSRNSGFLWGIALFIFLYTAISSFVYFELKNLLADFDEERRTQIWAGMDLVVNTLTILIAAFATGRMANHLGLPFTLASVPVAICLGMLVLAAAPMVAVVVAIQVARRAGNYAISRPAREMLFTAVDRETRFKAKPVIDIVIYRGGDMLNAWGFTALTQGLGLGMASVATVGAGIAAIWAGVGIYLGRQFNQMRPDEEATASPGVAPPESAAG